MRKILSLLMIFMASLVMVHATSITMPATTLDLQSPTIVTTASWTGEKAYYLDDDVLVTSGLESYKAVANQTWITQASAGSSASTWEALAPFKGSGYYTTASYATLQAGRYIAYLVTNCDSVWAYGYNNAATKYLAMNIYDVTGSTATSIDDTSVDATYAVDMSALGKQATGVIKQALDASKTYLVVALGTGNSNSRLFEIAFFRHPEPTTQDLYLKLNDDWAGYTEKFSVYYFNDTENGWSAFMTAVDGEENTYTTTIPVGFSKVIFVRNNSGATAPGWDSGDYSVVWSQTKDQTIPSGKNHFTITSGSTGKECDGTWAKYPVIPTYYVKGSFDSWGEGKTMEDGSYTFENLAKGTYQIKVTDGASLWVGYDKLDKIKSSANIYEGSDGNIKFTLAEAGNVTVAFDGSKVILTGTFAAPTTKFTVTVPNGTTKAFIAGNFNGWTPTEMTLKSGEEDVFELTVEGVESDTVSYKYLSGKAWKYVENRDDNRGYNAADVVSAWKAVPTVYKYAKVKAAPINWTGHYIIAWSDLKPHSVISGSDFVADAEAIAFVDGDTISVLAGDDYAVEIRFSETAGAYSIKLPNNKYIKLPGSNAVSEDDAAMALYMGYYKNTNQEGIQIADKADLTSTSARMIYQNSTNYRSYTNKINDKNYKLPTLYRLVNEAYDCQDGPYGVYINSKDTVKAVAQTGTEEYDSEGRKQYLAYISVEKGDKITVMNMSCGVTFLPEIESAGYGGHFKVADNVATSDTTGCFDLYIKLKNEDNKIYIGEGICPGDTALYYVVGDSALVTDAGYGKEKAWQPKAIKANQDTFLLEGLKANQAYEVKISLDGTWAEGKVLGFTDLSEEIVGLYKAGKEGDNNIGFKLKTAGDVRVVYKAGTKPVFKLLGDFKPACQDGPYALLVNGTDTIESVQGTEGDYTQYRMCASLTKNDKVQVINKSCGDKWVPTIPEGGASKHFAVGAEGAEVDSTGCYDFYFKKKSDDEHMWIAFGICPGDTALYYIAGSGGDLGWGKDEWVAAKKDTTALNLKAGNYMIKVVDGEKWLGYEALTDKTNKGLYPGEGENLDNICFTLKADGIVKVVYSKEAYVLLGDFYVPTPHFYIAGSMTNWAKDMVEMIPGNKDTMTVEIALEEATKYDFKVVKVVETDTTWYGAGMEATMHYGNSTGWELSGDANVGLQTTIAAKYLFIYEDNDKHNISVVIPKSDANYFITGDSAFVVDAGLDKAKAWNSNAIKSTKDTFELSLKGGQEYHMQVVVGDSWKGFTELTEKPSGVTAGGEYGNDIIFTLKADGKLQVVYTDKAFVLNGNFKPACGDGPYVVVVNETDTVKTIKGDEFEGYTQYVAYLTLAKNDKFQFVNASCDNAFTIAIQEDGLYKHFTLKDGVYTVDSTGCYDLYVKMKLGADVVYMGAGICPGDTARYYVAGQGDGLSWEGDKWIASTQDTLELNLKAGDYKLKVTDGGTNWYGYDKLTAPIAEGLQDLDGDDHNIGFTLKADGIVKVVFGKNAFALLGNFYVPEMKDLYLVPGPWSEENVKVAAWTWGDGMQDQWTSFFAPKAANNDTLVAKVNADADSIIFVHFNSAAIEPKWNGGEGYQWNQTPNLNIEWAKGIYTITGCNGYECNGTWDAYIPAKYYVTGDSAFVVDAGLEIANKWNPAAIKAEQDTLVIKNLKAGVAYQIALTVDGTWDTKKTYANLTEPITDGLNDEDGDNHNIGFTLKKAGDVKVVYKAGEKEIFKVIGDFYVEPIKLPVVALAGNMNNWSATANLFVHADDSLTASVTINVEAARTDSFKIVSDGKWLSAAGSGEACYEVNRGWAKAKNVNVVDGKNMVIVFDEKGEYTFTWTYADSSFVVTYPDKTIDPEAQYFLHNNWNGEETWSWKQATKQDDGTYKLENVVFGGNGVDYNTKQEEAGKVWVGEGDIKVADDKTIGALDTVTFVLDPAKNILTATILGKYQKPIEPEVNYYLKNNWNDGEWEWKKMAYVNETYKLENVVYGGTGVNWREGETGAENWIAEADFLGDKIKALDTVTLVFNPAATKITATIISKYVPAPVQLPVVALAGNMNNWSATANLFVHADDSLTASVTINVEAARTDSFKIVSDGKWLSAEGSGEACYEVNRGWAKAKNVNVVDGKNMVIVFDEKGEYTFTWTYADSSFVVTYPDKTIDPEAQYFLHNNWNGEETWSWKQATKQDDGTYKLENVVFGGNGVDYNTKQEEAGKVWVGEGDIVVADNKTIGALDTVTFVLDPAKNILTATILGKYQKPVVPEMTLYFVNKDEWAAVNAYVWGGEDVTAWPGKAMTKITEKACNMDVYSITFAANNDSIIFNNGDTEQTSNEVAQWSAAKPYFYDNVWYASIDEIQCPVQQRVFTVVGDAKLIGYDWDAGLDKQENEMALQTDGTYKLVKENILLGTGTYNCKVVINHTWAENYPAENYPVNIAADGYYKVTFTFNDETKVFAAVAEKTGEATVENQYMIVGEALVANGLNWDNSAVQNKMSSADDGLTYTLVVTNAALLAKDYKYQVVEFQTWNAYYPATGDAILNVPADGIYTITYTYTVASQTCEVKLQKTGEYEYKLADGYYLVGKFSGVESWKIENLTAAQKFTKNEAAAVEEYSITATLAAGDEFKAVYVEKDVDKTWYPADGNYVVSEDQAGLKTIYFRPNDTQEWGGSHFYIASDATGLDALMSNEKVVKVMQNGQIYILRDGKIYTVQGQLVK